MTTNAVELERSTSLIKVEPKKIFLSIDIETGGNEFKHPLLAVGICLASLEEGVIEKKTWCCKPESAFEMRCFYEFWYRYPDILKRIDQESKPLKEQMESLDCYLYMLERKYPHPEYKMVLISDNPAFDIGHLDYYFCQAINILPIRYSRDNRYLNIVDPSQRLASLDMKDVCTRVLAPLCAHDHYPENDAEECFWQYVVSLAATYLFKITHHINSIKDSLDVLSKDKNELATQLLALAKH